MEIQILDDTSHDLIMKDFLIDEQYYYKVSSEVNMKSSKSD